MNPPTAPTPLSGDARAVADAMALLWTWRPRTAIYDLLRHLGTKTSAGKAFTQDDVKQTLATLKRNGMLVEHGVRQGYLCLADSLRDGLYRALFDERNVVDLRDALYRLERFVPERSAYYWPVSDFSATVAIFRLALFSGDDVQTLAGLRQRIGRCHDWNQIFRAACLESLDPILFERIVPEWRWEIAYYAVCEVCWYWTADRLPMTEWALGKLATERDALPEHLRLQLAELLLHRGETDRVLDVLAQEDCGAADALRAAVKAQQGRWAEAQAEFEAAFKRRQEELGARKRLLPESVAWLYPLALLAQQTPRHLETARKFCVGESGTRQPAPRDRWGIWVHAIDVRRGDAPLEAMAFDLSTSLGPYIDTGDIARSLLRTWLGPETVPKPTGNRAARREEILDILHEHLQACGLSWLDGQLATAEAVFAGAAAPASFFVRGKQEAWRAVLGALQALGAEASGDKGESVSRLVWSVRLDKHGGIDDIQPLEQKRGPRGWSKPKALSLSKLAGNERLEPWDAKVARAVRKDRYSSRSYAIDRAQAIVALVGHPAVVLDGVPDTLVDVVEGTPEVEVVREGGGYVMRISPPLSPDKGEEPHFYDADAKREYDALRFITVMRDSPQRIRVVRLTPAQRRAAHLVGGGFAVPEDAQTELQQTLQALAGHFHIQSDHAEAAREVAAETSLRAELAPVGDALTLRLVAAPLGAPGPRPMPGAGRARLMAAIGGETVGTQRDLAAEQAHLDTVLDALPFLDPPQRGDLVCEWTVSDPEQALTLVETLPRLPGIDAVDWPRGKAVRVVDVDSAKLSLQVHTGRDWFAVKGRAQLDEGKVFELEALLAAAAGKSRFVPMGKGVYAALTEELRARLADLAAVAEAGPDGLRVPALAAAWLDEVLEGTTAETDKGFRAKVERLRAAQDLAPALPAGLQAELRPYQEDGYAWTMRLAHAGFGACLADDMGLGKTLQALAVLLARGEGGPALVIAPTSVCGNWLAETRRFAPALNPVVFGEGERAALVETAAANDVIIVSYTLMQQAQELFASRTWHTVVADEAQAVKNAAAKRSLALYDIAADFRLALSGTPVENRLSELWSIMRYCNPGLLGTAARFNERFAAPIERNRDRDVQRLLRRLIAPFVLRRTKARVLDDLPPRTELVLAIAPDADQAAHYEALRRQAVSAAETAAQEGGGQAQLHILAQLTGLRRAACDPRLTSPELGIVGAKVRAFAELAAELSANGHKTLVFSQFVDFLALLRAPLDAAGISYQYLDGATPAAERGRRVAAFQAGAGDLFLISLKAGGFGLNLTAADYVVITDPWWNPAAEDQAMGRAHRIGQQRPVTVYRLVAKGTLEERIVELHHDKRALAEGVLADGSESAALPSSGELIALMRGE